jgi:GTP-binding protein Era
MTHNFEDSHQDFRSGFIALIGRPNVGKSTLLNRLVGQKLAITSPVAQTTRRRLRGILTLPQAQLIFVDTPGIHKPHHLLGERLVRSACDVIRQVDCVLFLVKAHEPPGRGDAFIADLLYRSHAAVHVALTHWDLVKGSEGERQLDDYRERLTRMDSFDAPVSPWPFHPISALTGFGIETMVQSLVKALPPGPCLFPADTVSDQSEQMQLAELVREQVLHQTREEVPHSVAVQIDRIEDLDRPERQERKKGGHPVVAVLATILVERQSQKAILIGRGGRMLRSIGSGSRHEMEALLGRSVYLELFVKVVPHWRRNASRLAELGYGGEE